MRLRKYAVNDRTRRQFRRLCGVAGFGALAGCSTGSQDDEPSPGEQPTSASDTSPQTPVQQAKLAADDGDSDDRFGASAAVSNDGTTALVGAPHDEDPNGAEAGSAYIFDGASGSWRQRAKLTPDDGDSDDFFGFWTELSGTSDVSFSDSTQESGLLGPTSGSGGGGSPLIGATIIGSAGSLLYPQFGDGSISGAVRRLTGR